MIKNKKTLLVLISLLVIFYILISIIISFPKGKKFKNTVIIGNSTKVNVKNGSISVYNDDIAISNQKMKIFFKNRFVDGYLITEEGDSSGVNNIYTAYNENGDILAPEKVIIAYTPDISIKVKESNINDSTNMSDISDLIKLNNITLTAESELDYIKITNFDYDNDGNEEYIYSVGIFNNDKYNSFVYMKADDKYILIDSEESDNNPDYKRLYFIKLIDFNSDDNYEFVVEKMMSEYGPDYYELYNFDGNKFTKLGGE